MQLKEAESFAVRKLCNEVSIESSLEGHAN